MRPTLLVSLLVAIPLSASLAGDLVPVQRFNHEQVLGTSFELKVFDSSHEQAVKAESAALAEIDRLAKILSSYDPDSEVSRWQRTRDEAVAVSEELGSVLRLFDDWRARTDGALDPAAAAVARIWQEAASRGQLPSDAERASAVADVARPHWQLDGDARTATHLSDTPLVFNSLTKSFIIERAAAAAMSAAMPAGMVLNIGGDIVVRGEVRETIAIADPLSDAENAAPLDRIIVAGGAVATSGNYRRGFDIAGHHYSHIVDPRTGLTAEAVISATVIAQDASTAGAIATSMCVLTPDESARLAETQRVDYLIVMPDGRQLYSPGWTRLQRPRDGGRAYSSELRAILGNLDESMQDWQRNGGKGMNNSLSIPLPPFLCQQAPPNGFELNRTNQFLIPCVAPVIAPKEEGGMELVIELELKRINDARYRRPYVAVWIEDKDKFPVRTIALWYGRPRWLPDLRVWTKGDQLRKLVDTTDLATTISSASRSAGKYTLQWDGKDDKGVAVKAGKYTVMIEAAREHGTYQLMKQEMEFTGAPKQIKLKGNAEIEGVTLDYRRKTATAPTTGA